MVFQKKSFNITKNNQSKRIYYEATKKSITTLWANLQSEPDKTQNVEKLYQNQAGQQLYLAFKVIC